jgi:DNA repair protein RecO (recombination protein O)
MARINRSTIYKAEGIVLSRRDLGDMDRIVTLYTREFGRRRLVARSVKRPNSQFAPHIELFTRVRVVAVAGMNLDVLTQAQTIKTYPQLRDDLTAYAAAGWVIELIDGLSIDGESVPTAYAAIAEFLELLNAAQNPPEPLLSAITLKLLDIHGYGPELTVCTLCARHIEAGNHKFGPQHGGVVCKKCAQRHKTYALHVDTLKLLRYISREGLKEATRLRTDQRTRGELRHCLSSYLATVIEREIRSARILERAQTDRKPHELVEHQSQGA